MPFWAWCGNRGFFMSIKQLDHSVQPVQLQIFRRIYRQQLTEVARKSKYSNDSKHSVRHKSDADRAYIYTTQDCHTYTFNRSYKTLLHQAKDQTYYTPNTFYRNDKRAQNTLRFLNAFVLDVDVKNGQNSGLTLPDLLDRIVDAGLSVPSFIVRTPSGGFHVYFVLETPRKAYSNTLLQYHKIQRAIAEEIGADLNAIGAERVFRIPTDENIAFQSDFNVTYEEMCDWYWINHSECPTKANKWVKRKNQSLLNHPAFQIILKGVQKGQRDNAAYTLALAYMAEGRAYDDAEEQLLQWNDRLEEPMTKIEVQRKVKSAYFGSKNAPSRYFVEALSGVSFSYQIYWEPAKPRSERKNSHFDEWAEDILNSLHNQPECRITNSQRKLAEFWGMSLSSFQCVIEQLLSAGKITVEVTGKGRAAATTITLVPEMQDPSAEDVEGDAKDVEKKTSTANLLNVPNSNTNNLVTVVGGLGSPVVEFVYWRGLFSGRGDSPP